MLGTLGDMSRVPWKLSGRVSISWVSLTPSPFPKFTKADLTLGPKEMGLG